MICKLLSLLINMDFCHYSQTVAIEYLSITKLTLQAVESLRTIAADHSSQDLENHFVPLVKRLSQGLFGSSNLHFEKRNKKIYLAY